MELPLIHTGYTKSAVYSNNSKYILSANENTAFIWDSKTAKKIRSFTDHTDEITDISFSPDDKYFLSSSNDGTLNIYEVASGKLFQQYKSKKGSIRFAKFNSDGSKISLINHFSTLEIYDLKTSRLIFSFSLSDRHIFMSAHRPGTGS
jgi:WD40 repeat protein